MKGPTSRFVLVCVVTVACAAGAAEVVTITDIQAGSHTKSPKDGKEVTVKGAVVTAVCKKQVWIQQTDGAKEHAGVLMYDPDPIPKQGDLVDVTGEVGE